MIMLAALAGFERYSWPRPRFVSRALRSATLPSSCALSFVHVCQYVTDRYTAASLGTGMPRQGQSRHEFSSMSVKSAGESVLGCGDR